MFDRSTFEVDSRDAQHPVLRVETVIDGKVAYQYVCFPSLHPFIETLTHT